MKKNKRASFDESLYKNEMHPINQQYVNEYIKYSESENKNKDTILKYKAAYERIFKYIENWDIDFKDYNSEIYLRFQINSLDSNISPNRLDFFSSAISNLGKFLQEKYPDKFDRNFLKDIERNISEEKKNAPSRALKIYELNSLKEYLKLEDNYKVAYVFYIYYHYDIKKSDFHFFDPNKANKINNYFIKGTSKIYFTDQINSIVNSGKKFDKLTQSMVEYYFKIMTTFLQEKGFFSKEQSFTFDGIKQTRKRYFMKCPCCYEMSENISDNWVLVRLDFSDVKQLVCKKCKGENYNEES